MNLNDLRQLELSTIGDWPQPVKIALIAATAVVMAIVLYLFLISPQQQDLNRYDAEEIQLRTSFEQKQAKAVNLDSYRAQLRDMRSTFNVMLRQLPSRSEVANLLIDVSQAGIAAGLEFELFQPQAEVNRGFYSEMPISLRVVGNYHQFGEFISALAAMPRIMTVHNIRIRRDTRQPRLIMEAVAKTYYYLEEDEQEPARAGR